MNTWKRCANVRQEGESGIIELKAIESVAETNEVDDVCDDPEIVKLMVEYFYHFDYLPGAHDRLEHSAPKKNAVEQIDRLAGLTSQDIASEGDGDLSAETLANSHPPPAGQQNYIIEHAKVFAMTVKYQVDGLRQLARSKFFDETINHEAWKHHNFAQTISVIYNSTVEDVEDLREIVIDLLDAHLEGLTHKDDIETVICSTPHLSYNLLKRSRMIPRDRARAGEPLYRECSTCHKGFPSNHDGLAGSDPVGWLYCSIHCNNNWKSASDFQKQMSQIRLLERCFSEISTEERDPLLDYSGIATSSCPSIPALPLPLKLSLYDTN